MENPVDGHSQNKALGGGWTLLREELSMKWGEKYFRNSILRKGILEMTKF